VNYQYFSGVRMKVAIYYALLCIFSFLIAFSILTPVRIIAQTLLPTSNMNGWQFDGLAGNLWQGEMQLRNQQGLNANINWHIQVSHIFSDQSVILVHAKTAQSKLDLSSSFNGLNPAFRLQGLLDSQEISAKLDLPNQASMTGDIEIESLFVEDLLPYYVTSGHALWSGGSVSANRKTNVLPALNISIKSEQGGLNIQLTEKQTDINVIDIVATPDKQAEIQLAQRLLTLTKQGALSDNERDYVIRFTEKLTFF